MTYISQMPLEILIKILKEVVLDQGDKAILTLSLVCVTFRDTIKTRYFRERAHFEWLDSKYSCANADF